MSNDVVDAKIAAAEARTDSKIEKALGEMRSGFERMDSRFKTLQLWFIFTALGVFVGGVSLSAAILTIGRILAPIVGASAP